MDRPEPSPDLRTGVIARFWAPLALTWLMMSVEGPTLAAIIARLPDPKINLAAYGVAFAFALVAEAPVIMLMAASTSIVRGPASYRALRNFSLVLSAAVTIAMVAVVLPPVWRWISGPLLNLDPEVAATTWRALILLLPWPPAIGLRRFFHGILIRGGKTRNVALGTVFRLVSMVGTAAGLAVHTNLDGASVGAAALSAGVIVEAAVARMMAGGEVRRVLAAAGEADRTWRLPELVHFYTPLAMTSLLGLGVQPLVTAFMGRGSQPLESLAAMPVVLSLVFVFRSLGLAFQEVAIALMGDRREGLLPLLRFAAVLAGAAAAGLALIALTPLSTVWFRGVSGLTPELASFAILPARILVVIPALTVVLSMQRALLVHLEHTGPVTWATALEVAIVVIVMAVGIVGLNQVGAVTAAVALVVGRIAANLVLVPPIRRALRHADAP
jgi:hypothetical protein